MRPVRWGLHPPPRSPMRTDVSRSLTNSPQSANRAPGLERSHLGDDPSLAKVGHQQVKAAKLQIPPKDGPHPLGFLFHHNDLAVLGGVSERAYGVDAQPLPLGARDPVSSGLGSAF